MRILNIKATRKIKRFKYPYLEAGFRKYPNLLHDNKNGWNFNINESNKVWSIDHTFIETKGKRLYLFAIKDLYDKSIIDFDISDNMMNLNSINCLERAFIKNNIKGNLILHSDNGSQFTSDLHYQLCKRFNVKISMSRKGVSIDNSPIENFFSMLKCELNMPNLSKKSFDDVFYTVKQYCYFYNNERISTKLKGMTPFEYRRHSLVPF